MFIFASDIPSIIRLTSAAGKKCRAQSSERPRCGYSGASSISHTGRLPPSISAYSVVSAHMTPRSPAARTVTESSPIQSVYASSAMAAFARMSDGPPPRESPVRSKNASVQYGSKSFLSICIAPDRRQTPLPARICAGAGIMPVFMLHALLAVKYFYM